MRIRPLLALGALFAVLSLTATADAATTTYVRIAGNDRVETAVVAANQLTPTAKVVYVATGDNFPDALSAGAAAALEGAPVLLVHATSLPDLTRNEISSLKPDKVVVVGGTSAIGNQVRQDLVTTAKAANANANVIGIDGATRYDTAAAVSTYLRQHVLPANQQVPVVYIASGEAFPDALAGSAAAGAGGGPLLLVQPSGPESQSFVDELQALHAQRVVILGGTGAISQIQRAYIQQQAGAVDVERVQGADRYETSVAIAQDAVAHGAFTSPSAFAFLATGENYPDGLAAGAIAGANKVPVLLTKKTCLPKDVSDEIDALQPSPVYVMGGTAAVAWSLDDVPPAC